MHILYIYKLRNLEFILKRANIGHHKYAEIDNRINDPLYGILNIMFKK